MTTIFLGLAIVTSAPALKEPVKDDAKALQGTWQLVDWVQGNARMSFWDGTTVEFLPDGKRLCRESADSVDERSYKLMSTANPPALDLIKPSGGPEPTVHPSIYKIDGDTLIISIGSPGAERPTGFEMGKDGVYMLMTYKRGKKKN